MSATATLLNSDNVCEIAKPDQAVESFAAPSPNAQYKALNTSRDRMGRLASLGNVNSRRRYPEC